MDETFIITVLVNSNDENEMEGEARKYLNENLVLYSNKKAEVTGYNGNNDIRLNPINQYESYDKR